MGLTPYTFLFAAVIVLIFGAGLFSVDAWLLRHYQAWIDSP
jgi:putative oxidoreductase